MQLEAISTSYFYEFEDLSAVKLFMSALRVVTPSGLGNTNHRFRGTCYLHLQCGHDGRGSKLLQNVCAYLQRIVCSLNMEAVYFSGTLVTTSHKNRAWGCVLDFLY
jgi:hypothetical protein